jgi:SNF2 family DNA or RNA helicase
MEFKRQDQDCGQVRIYVLPDDVGRSVIEREEKSLRKALHSLLAQLDISNDTWTGKWSRDGPMVHIDSSLDRKIQDEPSLFYLFNTLPSPKPNLDVVADRYANEAMYRILNSNIEGLKTEMYNYQRRSAALMLQREFNPGQIIDPRLRNVVDQRGGSWYCDVDTASCLRQPRTFEAATGGICAETMGLGKTLICLALILATRNISSQIPVEHSVGTIPVRPKTGSLLDMAAATIGRTGTPWKTELAHMETDGSDFSKCRDALKRGAGHYFLPPPAPRRESRNPKIVPPRKIWLTTATLVVVPTNLVQQWLHEIKKHTTGLKVLTMNELSTPLPSSEDLAEYDILLFSKQRFEKEATVTTETNDDHFPSAPRLEDFRRGEDWLRAYSEHRAAPIPVPYHSPLKDLHFKRLIVDEGHTFGNSSSSSRTEAVTVVEFLQLSARWIISGTPTQGLYGAEVAIGHSEHSSSSGTPLEDEDLESSSLLTKAFPHLSDRSDSDTSSETSKKREAMFFKQERKDLEKLGNIATVFLKARPWANSYEDKDHASWSQHVMQPRHGSKSRGNTDCLKATLEGMIIRHRPDDVLLDIALPPLHQTIVYLEGSIQNKLSLNTFSMMVTSNAVTSERKDADYFFHPRQRKALLQLVANLRQASFFWSGFEAEHVRNTVELAKKFLEEKKVPVAAEDEGLLREAIKAGEAVLSNDISQTICKYHEMPMYIQNEFPDDVKKAWALDSQPLNPTLMGATMVHSSQKFVESQLWKEDPMDGLLQAGEESMKAAFEGSSQPSNPAPKKKTTKAAKKKAAEIAPTLAGGVSVGDALSPRRTRNGIVRQAPSSTPSSAVLESLASTTPSIDIEAKKEARQDSPFQDFKATETSPATPKEASKPKSILKKSTRANIAWKLDSSSPLASTSIISTASTKLSYLMDRILLHQEDEKILVFYEADNVAYYIAQALECIGIKHLIYAKTLSSARRAQYVVTFNQSQVFRVLLMDVSQAAFGLDMSSASRVYFVNPVFSPQVEAQAVKRAHRIGQMKPVYVETLVLKGSIEEVIVERRKDMSTEEHNKCKSILDDQTMYDWIKNVRFQPIPEEEIPGPEQMAKLETPQLVFGRGAGSRGDYDPDEDLVFGEGQSKKAKKGKGRATAKGKRKAAVAFAEEDSQGMMADIQDADENAASGMPEPNQLWNLL